jgi:eukaryotic-like serine/threonine-protein kinase
MITVVGQYKVLERLGEGALGEVLRARDTRTGRTVALMVVPPTLMSSPSRRARFLEDAHKATTLNHPNIAMLFSIVEQDGGCYLAYEFAAGPSLRDEMAGAALEARTALHVAAHLADALAEGHTKGVVHGDVRPETIVVTPKGSVKVLNFGMTSWTTGGIARAKAATAPDALDREEARIAGYLSPEQARGATADLRSDLFALGAVLYEALTGQAPFAAATPRATIEKVLAQPPLRPSAVNRKLPAELDAMVMKLLAREPDRRFQTAAAAAAEIRRITATLDATLDHAARPAPEPSGKQGRGVAALIACAALAAMALWWLLATW